MRPCAQLRPGRAGILIAPTTTTDPHVQRTGEHRGDARLADAARRAPKIAGLATLVPDAVTTQQQALERLGLADDEFASRIFERSGVQTRELNLDEPFRSSSLQERTADVEQWLLAQATRAIDSLDVDLRTVGTVVTSSLYSLGCPSLAHRLIEHYRLDPATDKYHVTAVGCASAVPLLRLSSQIVHANPSREVLVVAAESMSSLLTPSVEDDPRVKTVGSAIFGDGCAAAVLSERQDAAGPAVLATAVHQVPGTLDAVELTCEGRDSYLALARALPRIAGEQLSGLVDGFLQANRVDPSRVSHWMLHPGGRRIVEEARDALGLDDDDVAISWQALAEHGNVGTPSIFYVLDSTIRERSPAPGDLGLAVTIGPGVTVGLMLLSF